MRSRVAQIEAYLKALLAKSPQGWIEIQRKDLAERFSCVPSQITYVVNTRFSSCYGYFVESRRGGGGYIRIWELGKDFQEMLDALAQKGVFTEREVFLLNTIFRALEARVSSDYGSVLKLQIMQELLESPVLLPVCCRQGGEPLQERG